MTIKMQGRTFSAEIRNDETLPFVPGLGSPISWSWAHARRRTALSRFRPGAAGKAAGAGPGLGILTRADQKAERAQGAAPIAHPGNGQFARGCGPNGDRSGRENRSV